MSVQYIENQGKKAFAVIPVDDYEALLDRLEMAEDLAAIAEFEKNPDELIPSDIVARLLSDESNVKVWREYRKLTQTALAAAAGISQSAIAQIEATGGGSVDTFKKLAAALDVDLDDLV